MNVSLKNIDATKGIVKLEIVKADYADKVEKSLRSFRQKAEMPGFRKGMVPMGMVKKMYGKHVLVEEINKLVSENLYNYIRENKLNILGEPLPNETEQKEINFDTQEDFEFCFDVALAPEIKIELSKNDKVPYYQVNIDDEMIGKQVEAYQANFGTYDQVEDVEEKDLVKGTVAELEFASFLNVNMEAVSGITGDFSFEITEVSRHKNAELNQELFDKVFGEGVVTSEEEFKNKIREALAEQFTPQSDFKFLVDARDLLVQKAGELSFAEDLLKRWLLVANEKNTKEKIDEEYPRIIEDLKYQLIKENLVKENGLKVEDADIEGFAKRVAKAQFAQYGMLSVPEDVLANYAKDILKNKQTLQNIIDRAVEEKLAGWLKEQVELDTKEVTADEFNKLFEE